VFVFFCARSFDISFRHFFAVLSIYGLTDSDQIRHGGTCEEGTVARGSGTSHPNEAGPVLLKFMGPYLHKV